MTVPGAAIPATIPAVIPSAMLLFHRLREYLGLVAPIIAYSSNGPQYALGERAQHGCYRRNSLPSFEGMGLGDEEPITRQAKWPVEDYSIPGPIENAENGEKCIVIEDTEANIELVSNESYYLTIREFLDNCIEDVVLTIVDMFDDRAVALSNFQIGHDRFSKSKQFSATIKRVFNQKIYGYYFKHKEFNQLIDLNLKIPGSNTEYLPRRYFRYIAHNTNEQMKCLGVSPKVANDIMFRLNIMKINYLLIAKHHGAEAILEDRELQKKFMDNVLADHKSFSTHERW